MQIDASHVKGEPGTGYEGPAAGLFQCSNCRYFRNGSCGQPTMMQRSQQPKGLDGRVTVEPGGCCEYVDRVGPQNGQKTGNAPSSGYESQLAGYGTGKQETPTQGGTR